MKGSAAILAVVLVGGNAAAAPSVAVELAGTLSGKTQDPEVGIRAAVIKTVTTSTNTGLGLVGRFDRHGAPAERGAMFEAQAVSLGIGLRGWIGAVGPQVRYLTFLEVSAGRTSARNDTPVWHDAGHTMVSAGFLVGPARSNVSAVFDFGWMFTSVGEDYIGPIASFGVNVSL
jgi:hypothetical protein